METFKPPSVLNLTGNLRENWRRWIQRFELFLTASVVFDRRCVINENPWQIYTNQVKLSLPIIGPFQSNGMRIPKFKKICISLPEFEEERHLLPT
ncbi:Hypothetical predicted protein, partial [Paramuricea clavata]